MAHHFNGQPNGYDRGAADLGELLSDPSALADDARRLLGAENRRLSSIGELRFGTHGSLSVDLEKAAYFDHERGIGGGFLDLINERIGGCHSDALAWLRSGRNGTTSDRSASTRGTQPRRQVASYDYVDEQGGLVFQVVRYEPKAFRQRRPENGGWTWNVDGVPAVPYRLPELLEATAEGRPVTIHEGEKDVDRALGLGVPATCNAGGAGKWNSGHAAYMSGADAVIFPDNDDAGAKHAEKVAQSLVGIAVRIRVVRLPGLPPKGDLCDWVDAGGTAAALWKLVGEATDWEPAESGADANPEPEAGADQASVKAWPTMLPAALKGLVGSITEVATRKSEADPVAVMTTMLTASGALFGRSRYVRVGDSVHHPRLFTACVGSSSRARKGTSAGPTQRIVRAAEEALQQKSSLPFPCGKHLRMSNGPLSSGEGLIEAIRDKRGDEDEGGTTDKRLLVLEGEMGSTMRAFQRQGNTLSTILRTAWDGNTLEPLTKREKIVASEPHICIVAHVTKRELNELLSSSDLWNGFAHRFLWNVVRRRAEVPFPQPMPDDEVAHLGLKLAEVVEYAHSKRNSSAAEMRMSNSAADHWANVYSELTQDYPGILGAVTARAEAQTLRLALTYALLDGADRIDLEHLESALAIWRYAADSAAYLFGEAELDPIARSILEALDAGPKTQTEIRDLFARHIPAPRLAQVLTDLQERGRITLQEEKTGGRPRKVWRRAV
jgi:Protein of unknown function (DUF3987)